MSCEERNGQSVHSRGLLVCPALLTASFLSITRQRHINREAGRKDSPLLTIQLLPRFSPAMLSQGCGGGVGGLTSHHCMQDKRFHHVRCAHARDEQKQRRPLPAPRHHVVMVLGVMPTLKEGVVAHFSQFLGLFSSLVRLSPLGRVLSWSKLRRRISCNFAKEISTHPLGESPHHPVALHQWISQWTWLVRRPPAPIWPFSWQRAPRIEGTPDRLGAWDGTSSVIAQIKSCRPQRWGY